MKIINIPKLLIFFGVTVLTFSAKAQIVKIYRGAFL